MGQRRAGAASRSTPLPYRRSGQRVGAEGVLLRRGRGLVRRGEGVGGDGGGSSAAAKGSAMEEVRPVASQQVVRLVAQHQSLASLRRDDVMRAHAVRPRLFALVPYLTLCMWAPSCETAAVQLSGTLSGELRASLLLCSSPGP